MKSLSDLSVEQCQVIDQLADQFEDAIRAGQRPSIENLLVANSSLRPYLLKELLAIEIELRRSADEWPSKEEYLLRFPDDPLLVEAVLNPVSNLASTADPSRDIKVEEEPPPERLDRYVIRRQLGRGGFGVVYLAHDEQLNRPVAIKVPHAKLISVPEDAQTYLAEARTVAKLDHPGIVPVHDVGSTEKYPCYVVSKYVPGTDLATKLKHKRLEYTEAAELVATVADALHYAHKQGLVHRDIKPGNILVGNDGKPYVVDFGLALREEDIGKGPRYAGTPAYMSPEQVRGEGHRVDGRSDIFSLGVVFYELLIGHRPFRGDTQEELFEQVTSYEAKPLRQYDDNIPKELERICHKAMAKRASDRYSTAKDLSEDLGLFLADLPIIQSRLSLGDATSRTVGMKVSTGASTSSNSGAGSSESMSLGSSDHEPIMIVPKGLRSFEAHDADFFLELLPGPRDRNGLPNSLRFWKARIEETGADGTFTVGLIYGPSGCGKSSLVKAGLLPRLSKDVIPVYIEATPEKTETRLLHGLRKRFPSMNENLILKDTLATLRRGQYIPVGKKVLIVLDQFEQWLHAKKQEENSDLVQALRQCDGGRVQCIVLVRDDFWMAVTRFLRELEVELIQGQNFAPVDLFPIRHAEKVLAAFGRAFGALPDYRSELNKEQKSFITQAVVGLAEEGKVICVRLALFAEMVKEKAWTPATLQEVGGTTGVGVAFLEETFSAQSANPRHRFHQKAARAVLNDLLPNSGTDIKGCMRSYVELLEASGYGNRTKDFEDLIRILDSEIRLITPTDPEGKDTENDSLMQPHAGQKYFQLTHDYLVHSLRDWLTRKQKETSKGRAELKLLETSTTWKAKPENRFLPSLGEWINIRRLTDRKRWTQQQRAMIRRADQFYSSRLTTAVAILGLMIVAALWTWHRVDQNRSALLAQKAKEQEATRIEGLVGRLVSAIPTQLLQIVKELDANPAMADTFLSPLIASATNTKDARRSQLHARLAMVSRDKSLVAPLLEELLANKIAYIGPIRQQLRPYAGELIGKLWAILRDDKAEASRRFHAALALADYVPDTEAGMWSEQNLMFVAQQLVSANAEIQPQLRENLRPIRGRLLENLEKIFGDSKAKDAQRLSAANALADYAGNDILKLSRLLVVANPEQFAVLYPIVAATPTDSSIEYIGKIVATPPPKDLGSVARVTYGQRRANAAITLLRMGELEKVLPVFDLTDDPEALTQFIFRCRPRRVGVLPLLDCMQLVTDAPKHRYPVHTRYALLLALGEFSLEEIPAVRRETLLDQLADWYQNDSNSGVHGASGWLLRQWGKADIAQQVDQTPVAYSPDREWFTLAITVKPTLQSKPMEELIDDKPRNDSVARLEKSSDRPHVLETDTEKKNAFGSSGPFDEAKPRASIESLPLKTFYYTFIVFPAGDYEIGSVSDEPDRIKSEVRHPVKLSCPFALLDREITWEEMIAFEPMYYDLMQEADAKPEAAAANLDWYDAVGFCRWLGKQSGWHEVHQAYPAPELLDKVQYPREPNPSANWAPRDWPLELGKPGFRLPTEAEWEVASRAGTRTTYGFGSEVALLRNFGWFLENSDKRMHPPRELRPSIRGLFDMHGNMFEWTHDWQEDQSVHAVTDPLGVEGSSRVFRGGGWYGLAAYCRSADRDAYDPTYRSDDFGFRLALNPSGVTGPEEKRSKKP